MSDLTDNHDAHIDTYDQWRLRMLTAALNPGFFQMSGLMRWHLLELVGRRMTAEGMWFRG